MYISKGPVLLKNHVIILVGSLNSPCCVTLKEATRMYQIALNIGTNCCLGYRPGASFMKGHVTKLVCSFNMQQTTRTNDQNLNCILWLVNIFSIYMIINIRK